MTRPSSLPTPVLGIAALAGPVLFALSVVFLSMRPSALAVAAAAVILVCVVAADAIIIARDHWGLITVVLAMTGALVLFITSYLPAPLSPPAPLVDPLPPASPPPGMAAFQLPTGVTHRTAAFGYRGGSPLDWRDFTMTSVLVTHPRGDLLIDTGLGRTIDEQFRTLMPGFLRMTTTYEHGLSAAEQLDAAGYDRKRLKGIILTHAHWDHASGGPDFPETPILITPSEHRFVEQGGWITAFARASSSARFREYEFEGGRYLGFPRSHDFYGDGSIVAVPAPGHTPGSVIVFVTLPVQSRFAFVGDLIWQLEGVTRRELRTWLIGKVSGENADEVRENILRMVAVSARYPAITIVPAHDSRGFTRFPVLEASRIR